MKEVIKKQIENSPKCKGGEKTRMMQMIRLIRPMLTKFGIISQESFLWLNIRSSRIHFQLDSSAQIFKILAFDAILFTFSLTKLSLKFSLKLVEFKWEKVIVLPILKNVKNFVNATTMENCFGMLTF